jgi:transposase-like protein
MRYIAKSFTVTAAAEQVGIDRKTMRRWRDSIEGQKLLDDARKARAAQFADAADQARRTLREATPLAALRLRDRLDSTVPFEAINAAEAILSRVGVPRATKVESTGGAGLDLSKLSDDELATLEQLHAKASGGAPPP